MEYSMTEKKKREKEKVKLQMQYILFYINYILSLVSILTKYTFVINMLNTVPKTNGKCCNKNM